MLNSYTGNLLFVSGKIEAEQKKFSLDSHTYMNFMTSSQVEQAMQESALVLCRSGYSTVMDLVALNKKAFFIPTPGQFEQEYLAKRLKKAGFFPFAKQSQFKLEHLLEVDLYKTPFSSEKTENWKNLLCLFDRE
jgi:UDP-N-acetylglucosamine:LPS N-acetylglucosamine transferase